eukprot:scaffold439_cov415-Prasinococcus_capsulatus_cf.AAC.22
MPSKQLLQDSRNVRKAQHSSDRDEKLETAARTGPGAGDTAPKKSSPSSSVLPQIGVLGEGVQGELEEDDEYLRGEVEEAYERIPRSHSRAWQQAEAVEDKAEPLPIKLPDGTLHRLQKPTRVTSSKVVRSKELDGDMQTGSQNEIGREQVLTPRDGVDSPTAEQDLAVQGRRELLDELAVFHDYHERAEQAQTRIAEICVSLTQDPEKSLHMLANLHDLCTDRDPQIARLAMLSLAAVFNDILPGYRIRLPSEKEAAMAVSKEVQKVQSYERALLGAYQKFVKTLVLTARHRHPLRRQAAVLSLCELVVHHPSFNYSDHILTLVVKRLDSQESSASLAACDAVQRVLELDTTGDVSWQIAGMIARLVKQRKCRVQATTVKALRALKYDEALWNRVSDLKKEQKEKYENRKKMKKGSKKKKGLVIDYKGIQEAYQEGEAEASAWGRVKQQSRTLEIVFEVYFRILKTAAAEGLSQGSEDKSGVPRELFECTLGNMSTFAHLINVDMLGDVLETMRRFVTAGVSHVSAGPTDSRADAMRPLSLAARLSCLVAVVRIIQGQGDALNVDYGSFYHALYGSMLEWPLAGEDSMSESERTKGGGLSPGGLWAVEEKVDSLLCECLYAMMVSSRGRQDHKRVCGFLKRALGIALLHSSVGGSLGTLGFCTLLMSKHPRLSSLLINEEEGGNDWMSWENGTTAHLGSPEASGAEGQCMWELALLSRHYHPGICKSARDIALGKPASPRGESLPQHLLKAYSMATGVFRPAVPGPKPGKRYERARFKTSEECSHSLEAMLHSHLQPKEPQGHSRNGTNKGSDSDIFRAWFDAAEAHNEIQKLEKEIQTVKAHCQRMRAHLATAQPEGGSKRGRQGSSPRKSRKRMKGQAGS